MKVNTFIIGVQKGATTSMYEWLMQHPNITGEVFLKDYPFFTKREFYDKGNHFLEDQYRSYTDQKIIMTGCVDYIEDEEGLRRIKEYNPQAKIILQLRNPEERLKSAFKFLNQISLEKHSDINKAVADDAEYLERSLYGKKLEILHEIFAKENIKILLFEEITSDPESAVKEVFEFLDVDPSFSVNFHNANKTGFVRFKFLNQLIFDKSTDNIFRYTARKVFPPDLRVKIRRKIKHLNTRSKNSVLQMTLDKKYTDLLKEDSKKVKKYLPNLKGW